MGQPVAGALRRDTRGQYAGGEVARAQCEETGIVVKGSTLKEYRKESKVLVRSHGEKKDRIVVVTH